MRSEWNWICSIDGGAQYKTELSIKFSNLRNFLNFVKKYADSRPANLSEPYCFVNYQKRKCIRQRVCVIKLGNTVNVVAQIKGFICSSSYLFKSVIFKNMVVGNLSLSAESYIDLLESNRNVRDNKICGFIVDNENINNFH